MSEAFERVKTLLISLDKEELVKAHAFVHKVLRIEADVVMEQKQGGIDEPLNGTASVDLLLRVLSGSTKSNIPGLTVLKKRSPSLAKDAQNAISILDPLLVYLVKGTVTNSDRAAFFSLFVSSVTDRLESMKVPATPRTILRYAKNFHALLRRDFPCLVGTPAFVDLVLRKSKASRNVPNASAFGSDSLT